MSALSVVASSNTLPTNAELSAEALDYGRAALSANTMRAYKADWAAFQDWCASRARGGSFCPPAEQLLIRTQSRIDLSQSVDGDALT